MRILAHKKLLLTAFLTLVISGISQAQNASSQEIANVDQDPRLEKLIAYKTQLNKNDEEKRIRIQIYNGPLEGAEEIEKEFTKKFDDITSNITFETPNYKVRVGNFRNRLEADRYLLKVKKEYPSAFIIQP